jgi:hypothetical protein
VSQLSLDEWFTSSTAAPDSKRAKPTIEERFASFDAANPHVYVALERLARLRLIRGDKRIGVKALWEELRRTLAKTALAYDPDLGTDGYKLNNDFTALYARKLIDGHPELAAVIEVRRRKGEH